MFGRTFPNTHSHVTYLASISFLVTKHPLPTQQQLVPQNSPEPHSPTLVPLISTLLES